MGKKGQQVARESREKRLQEISILRNQPIPPHLRWWTSRTITVVTGSNRGIGFKIARQFANGLFVVITVRDADRCWRAVETLREGDGLSNVESHQLDISDGGSIADFAKWIGSKFGGIDILNILPQTPGRSNDREFGKEVYDWNLDSENCKSLLL